MNNRDLELILMGALLSNPSLKEQISGFSDRTLASLFEELKQNRLNLLRAWLETMGVQFSPGKGEALKNVMKKQRDNWIRSEIEAASQRLKFATRLNSPKAISIEADRIRSLKEMLSPSPRKILKPPPATPERNPNEPPTNQKPTTRSAEVPDRAGPR